MYSINGIALSNFGISPGRVEASNIAIGGHLNMPERIGKIFHDWTGEQGVEPYVLESEIRHGGRTLNFGGYLQAQDRSTANAMLQTFYREIDSWQDLVPLVTPWGNHNVYIREKIEAVHLQAGWVALQLQFEEPVVPNTGILPAGNESLKPHFDGVALDSLGMFITAFKDQLNRAKIKEQQFTFYQYQGYQVTPAEALEFEIEIIAAADSYAALKANIASLQKLLSSPGTRTMTIDNRPQEVFNTKGFKVSTIKVAPNYAVCKITLPLYMASVGVPLQLNTLVTNQDVDIANNLNELIQIPL